MQQTPDALHGWFRSLQPIFAELFNAAHVICGNYELAEYALRSAILDAWLQNTGGAGFREHIRGCLRREAFDAALSEEGRAAEFTWPGLSDANGADQILNRLSREHIETQRMVMLRYGCGLSIRSVTRLTGSKHSQVKSELARFQARCRTSLGGQNRFRTEALITHSARRLLARNAPGNPQPAQIYRAFAAEVNSSRGPGQRASRIAGTILLISFASLTPFRPKRQKSVGDANQAALPSASPAQARRNTAS